ncbi:MAG: hypothetical protein LBU62_04580 [Bacteroidales bacterium]|jgi:hypothetical protein|nr:hypothetical protein [Bacteroidales bacterium]
MLTVSYACSPKNNVVSEEQLCRAQTYFQSENEDFEVIFTSGTEVNVQPKLTGTELSILDALASKIDKNVCQEFDNKCLNWMSCWAHISADELMANPQYALRCNEAEYRDLIDFCSQQDENILLLFYQLVAHANCPYDQLLLRPIMDLIDVFPEYGRLWDDINRELKAEKPDISMRTCNETTIWFVRKMLETKYHYNYTNRLASLFDSRRLLLMAQ